MLEVENHAVRFFCDVNDNIVIAAYRGSQQLTLTMKMTTEQVVETSATVNNIHLL